MLPTGKGKGRGRARGRGKDADQEKERRPGETSEVPRDVQSKDDNPDIPKSEKLEKPSEQIVGKYKTAGRGRGIKREIDGGDQDKGLTPSGTSQFSGGRGRGRGIKREKDGGDQDKGQMPSATSQLSGVTKEDFPELAALSLEDKAKTSANISVRPKILPKSKSKSMLPLEIGLPLENKSPLNFTFAQRPDYGKLGRPIEILVNYFMIHFKDVGIYHYDIDISDVNKDNTKGRSLFSVEETAKDGKNQIKNIKRESRRNIGKRKCRQIITQMFKSVSLRKFCPVYDGQRNLYTSKNLPFTKETSIPLKVPIDNKSEQFFVTIQPVKKKNGTNMISLEPLKKLYSKQTTDIPYEVLSVYETILNSREPPFEDIEYRNTFFSLQQENVIRLRNGLEIWFGYHKNVQLTELGPVVVIDTAAKAFHKSGPVIDYVNEVLRHMHGERFPDIKNIPKLDGRDIEAISEALKGVRVKVTHLKYPLKYRIIGLTDLSASKLTFEMDHKTISVADYFRKVYRINLSYPQLPCLQMQPKEKNTYIPMEVCVVLEGQAKAGKIKTALPSTMLGKTAAAPQKRFDNISKYARKVEASSKENLDAFNLIMDLTFLKVDGRIIASPFLEYGGKDESRFVKPDEKGKWRIEGGKEFYKVMHVKNWVVINFAKNFINLKELEIFCHILVETANKCGMRINQPNSIKLYDRNSQTEEAILNAKKSGAEFAMVVLHQSDKFHIHERVKFYADFKHNIVTQCIKHNTIKKITDQIATNICLQINVKLGGINHILLERPKFFTEPVIIMGADITKWPEYYGYSSILSVVGSLDQMACKYALTCDLQSNEKINKKFQTIIKNMDTISKEILEIFRYTNCWKRGIHPNKIIVFRNGVSELQFQDVLEYEVGGIQKASYDLFQKIIPITYIVVQKSTQTRFRTKNTQDVGSGQNVPPGTTVDKSITHPSFFQFFLVSHDSSRGTCKPARYTVLHNDNGFKSDELQELSYFLCYTNVRCLRSSALPAPLSYAGLAAYRAKQYAQLNLPQDVTETSGDVERDFPPVVVQAIRSMKCFQNNMFYV